MPEMSFDRELGLQTERLTAFFDMNACFGFSELIKILNKDEGYGVVRHFKIEGIHVNHRGLFCGGSFEFFRGNAVNNLAFFRRIAEGFEHYTRAELEIVDLVFLEVATSLVGKGKRVLFESFEATIA
jgi:hypothetical protein